MPKFEYGSKGGSDYSSMAKKILDKANVVKSDSAKLKKGVANARAYERANANASFKR